MSLMSKSIKHRLGYRWVKAVDSGRTYLCLASSFNGEMTDEQLQRIGIDESLNPQND